MTHACSHVFFYLSLFSFLSFSTELAPEWCNKVVSTATQKQLTDSGWYQTGAKTSQKTDSFHHHCHHCHHGVLEAGVLRRGVEVRV